MAESQIVTMAIERQPTTTDHWILPVLEWSGFRLKTLLDSAGNTVTLLAQVGSSIQVAARDDARLYAVVEIDPPDKDIEAAKLTLEQQKAKSEEYWRGRTYLFSIGSALLTAIVAITVAVLSRPSQPASHINVDAVAACQDSLQRLPTLARLNNQTVEGLTTAIEGHVQACDSVLQELTRRAAKEK
jgi:hypothetical protein